MNPEIKRQVLRKLTNGLYVATAAADGEVASSTVTWLTQASFIPPLVVVCLRVDGRLHAVIDKANAFAVSILSVDQERLAEAFFRPSPAAEGKISGHAYEAGRETGSPVLTEAPAWFEVRVRDRVKRGDHTVFVAEVVDAGLRDPEAEPLILAKTQWSYGG